MKITISTLKQIIKESVEKQEKKKVKSDKFQNRNTPENFKKRDATAGVTRTDSGELKEGPSLMDVTSLDDAEPEMDARELNDFQAFQQYDPDRVDYRDDFDAIIKAIVPLAKEKGMSVDEISDYLKAHKNDIFIGGSHPDVIAKNAVDRIGFKKSLGQYPKDYKPGNKTSDKDFMVGMNHSPETMLPGLDEITESLFGGADKVRKPLGPEFGFDSKKGLDFDNTRHFNNLADKGGIEGLKSKLSTLKSDEIEYLRKLSPQDFTKLVDQLERNKK